MAKKNFSAGLSSLISGTQKQPQEQNNSFETHDFLTTHSKKQSENKKLQSEKGYYRKTFLMDAELGRMVEIWVGYKKMKTKDKTFSEKQVADEALKMYFSKVDQNELDEAIRLFK